MLTIPMNYTSFGGTYTIATGVNAGSQVFGQDPLWLAWEMCIRDRQRAELIQNIIDPSGQLTAAAVRKLYKLLIRL